MERLTERYDITPDGESNVWVKNHDYIKASEKLAEYEDLEEQGLLVRLPCKVGTEVFAILPRDSHCTKCQIKKNRNPSNYIWKNMLLCRASCTKGMLLQIF